MTRFFDTFYARISAIFLILLLVLGVVLAIWTAQSAIRLTEAADQSLNRDLAHDLAPQFEPHVRTEIDQEAIGHIIEGITAANRRINVYLLKPDGMIKSAFVEPGRSVELADVDVEPLDRMIAGADDFPIFGDDPLHPGHQRPFSVAPLTILGMEGCYLYITLGTDAYDSALAMMRESFIARGTLRALPLALLLTAIAGLVLFGLVTRRLRRVTAVVQRFQHGDYDERVAETSDDEVGQLAASFNGMADTIVANLEELKRNDRLRRELVANVSHDLRSPLASIQGYLETVLMKQDELSAEEQTRFLDIALRNANRLSLLVAELFDLSKFDAQQIEPVPEAFSVAELVQDVVAQFQPRAEDRTVSLTATFPADLPMVYADIGLIERVIANLTDNALRHTPAGGRVVVAPSLDGEPRRRPRLGYRTGDHRPRPTAHLRALLPRRRGALGAVGAGGRARARDREEDPRPARRHDLRRERGRRRRNVRLRSAGGSAEWAAERAGRQAANPRRGGSAGVGPGAPLRSVLASHVLPHDIVRADPCDVELVADGGEAEPFVEPERADAGVAPQHLGPGIADVLDAAREHGATQTCPL